MAAENFILHIHTPDTVRKMKLTARPQSVDELKIRIKERCGLSHRSVLSFAKQPIQHIRRLLTLLRKKAACSDQVSVVLSQLFDIYDCQEQADANMKRALVLRSLSAYLHDDVSNFLKTWNMAASDEVDIASVSVGLLIVYSNTTDLSIFSPDRISVVLEGNMVIDVSTLADGYVILFGLMYALHLSYPKELANTFDFIQKVIMGLEDGKLRPRVLSLKNDLYIEVE